MNSFNRFKGNISLKQFSDYSKIADIYICGDRCSQIMNIDIHNLLTFVHA